MRDIRKQNEGFSLLELLLTLGIVGVIAAFVFGIAQSTKHIGKVSKTKARMEKIVAAAKDYYRGHEDLPASTTGTEVPVGSDAFNLEQKYRFDAWGQPFYYRFAPHPLIPTIIPIGIVDLTINDNNAAAVLISGGPNQRIDLPNYTTTTTFTTANDDIVLAIDVDAEAKKMTIAELKVLQGKTWSFDAMFEGIDNGGATSNPDDDPCIKVTMATQNCTFSSLTTGLTNDPNCGTATLDEIENHVASYSCDTGSVNINALQKIIEFYALADGLRYDPWGMVYAWGQGDPTPSPPSATHYPTSSPKYHKFFSWGPDRLANTNDDITP